VVEALKSVESLALRAALGLIQVQDALSSSRAIQEPRRALLGCETIEFALLCIRSFGLWKCSALGECSLRVMRWILFLGCCCCSQCRIKTSSRRRLVPSYIHRIHIFILVLGLVHPTATRLTARFVSDVRDAVLIGKPRPT
jgi:hypothetical protein